MPNIVKEITLRELVQAKSVGSVSVVGQRCGYVIVTKFGNIVRPLATSRGAVRVFTLQSASKFLRSVGIARFEVDIANHVEGRIRKARPDRAEALRRTRTKLKQQPLV